MGKGKKKEKIEKVRSSLKEDKNPPTFEKSYSAGGVVFRNVGKKNQFLLIKPAGINRWQLPKGLIKNGESSKQTALREVKEEGGVEAKIVEKLGDSRYFFVWEGKKIFKSVAYFLMKYTKITKDGHDNEVDEAKFFPFEKANKILTFKDDKGMVKKANELLKLGIQDSLL